MVKPFAHNENYVGSTPTQLSMKQLQLNNYVLPSHKNLYRTLLQISGINHKTILQLIRYCGLSPQSLPENITSNQKQKLIHLLEQFPNPNLKYNIQNLINKKTYRGWRHSINLPVRGQNTHRNAKTQRRLNPMRK